MNTTLINTLIGYNAWRNEHLLATAMGISATELYAATRFPSGSLGATFVHAMGAERIWTERMLGGPTLPFPKAADYPDLDAIRNGWKPIADALRDFALGCSEADLARVFSFRRLNGDQYTGMVAECILQVINHGTQHGAEIAQMLTEIGRSPGEIDLLRYIRARDARIAGGG